VSWGIFPKWRGGDEGFFPKSVKILDILPKSVKILYISPIEGVMVDIVPMEGVSWGIFPKWRGVTRDFSPNLLKF
jgi:hypothetical protein